MQMSATLVDFLSAWNMAIFVSLPLFLLIVVLLQEHLGWKALQGARRSEVRSPQSASRERQSDDGYS